MRISDWSSDVCSSDLQFHFGPLCCCAQVTQQGSCQKPKWALNKGFRPNINIPAPKFCAAQWPCLNFRQQRQWVASYSLRRYPVRNIQAIMTAQTTSSSAVKPRLTPMMPPPSHKQDRKSVVWGKRVYVSVNIGGVRI